MLFNRFLSGNISNFFSGVFAGIGITCIIAALIQMKRKK
jgi:tetrahydromethanopterin S-methyltransferase subunit B